MKIESSEDFVKLVSSCPSLMDFTNIQVLMSLRSVLNRGCKCNKKKKQEQLEHVYSKAIQKYQDNNLFVEIIHKYLEDNEINEILFFSSEELIKSIKL